MDNKRFRIAEIFKSLEQDMKKKGYCRSATQIHIKFKALKRNYNNCRIALSKSGAGVMKKCTFYDELHELFGCRPINIQKGMDSLNTASSVDVDMFDNLPDADGAIPGCSQFSDEFNESYINESESQFKNIDKSNNGSINETDCINNIEESSDLTIDKAVQQQLETSINNEIINNNNDVAMLESNKNKDSKKRVKSARSTNRQTFAQVFDSCVQKLIKSNEDITRIAIETQNTMINNILQQQEKMLQQQTQLLIQNLHVNSLQSQVTTNYCPNLEQFRRPVQSFNNPRFVKVPLNVIQSSERCSPVIVTPPSTPTPPLLSIPFSFPSPISTTSSTTFSATSLTTFPATSSTTFPTISSTTFPATSSTTFPVISSTIFPATSSTTFPVISSTTFPTTSSTTSPTTYYFNSSSTSTSSQVTTK